MRAGNLHVEVQGSDIIGTLPGTNYVVTYYRAAAFPQQLTHQVPLGPREQGDANDGNRVSCSRVARRHQQGTRAGVGRLAGGMMAETDNRPLEHRNDGMRRAYAN